jgi:hypothetical protein
VAGVGKRSCRSLAFECISTGNTRVWIRYGKEQLSTTAIIGCHLPLKAVHPEEIAIMSLGANIDVAFEGGPRPWTLHPEGHYSRCKCRIFYGLVSEGNPIMNPFQ